MFLVLLDLFMALEIIEQSPSPFQTLSWESVAPFMFSSHSSLFPILVCQAQLFLYLISKYLLYKNLQACLLHSFSLHTHWVIHNFNYYLCLLNACETSSSTHSPTGVNMAPSSQSSYLTVFHSCSLNHFVFHTTMWHGGALRSVSSRV